MSWALDDWKAGLPGRALQRVQELESQLEKLLKERQQRQFQLEAVEGALLQQKHKCEEARAESLSLQRELKSLSQSCVSVEELKERLSHELQARGAQVCSLEGQLGASRKQIESLQQELKRVLAELEKLQNSQHSGESQAFFTPTWNHSGFNTLTRDQGDSRWVSREPSGRNDFRALHVKQLQFSSTDLSPKHGTGSSGVSSSSSPFPWQQDSTPVRRGARRSETPVRRGSSTPVASSPSPFSSSPSSSVFPWEQEKAASTTDRGKERGQQGGDVTHSGDPVHCGVEEELRKENAALRSSVSELQSWVRSQEEELQSHSLTVRQSQSQLESLRAELAARELTLTKNQDQLTRQNTLTQQTQDKCQSLEQKLKQLSEELSCQRQNAESARRAAEQRRKEQEKEHHKEMSEQQLLYQSLEKQHRQESSKLHQELQQSGAQSQTLQTQRDKVTLQKQRCEKELEAVRLKLQWTERELQGSHQREEELKSKLTETEKQLEKLNRELALNQRLLGKLQAEHVSVAAGVPLRGTPPGESYSPPITKAFLEQRSPQRGRKGGPPGAGSSTAGVGGGREPGEGREFEEEEEEVEGPKDCQEQQIPTGILKDSRNEEIEGAFVGKGNEESRGEFQDKESDGRGRRLLLSSPGINRKSFPSSREGSDWDEQEYEGSSSGKKRKRNEKGRRNKEEGEGDDEMKKLEQENEVLKDELREARREVERRLEDLESQRKTERDLRVKLKQTSKKHSSETERLRQREQELGEKDRQLEAGRQEAARLREAVERLESEAELRQGLGREEEERSGKRAPGDSLLLEKISELEARLRCFEEGEIGCADESVGVEKNNSDSGDGDKNSNNNNNNSNNNNSASSGVSSCNLDDLSFSSEVFEPAQRVSGTAGERDGNPAALLREPPRSRETSQVEEGGDQELGAPREMAEEREASGFGNHRGEILPTGSENFSPPDPEEKTTERGGVGESGREAAGKRGEPYGQPAVIHLVLEVEKLRRRNEALDREREEAQGRASEAQGKLETLQSRINSQTRQLTLAFETQSQNIEDLLGSLEEKDSALRSLEQELQGAKESLISVQGENERLKSELGAVTLPKREGEPVSKGGEQDREEDSAIKSLGQELQGAKESLISVQGENDELRSQLGAVTPPKREGELAVDEKTVSQDREEDSATRSLCRELQVAKESLISVQRENERLKSELAAVTLPKREGEPASKGGEQDGEEDGAIKSLGQELQGAKESLTQVQRENKRLKCELAAVKDERGEQVKTELVSSEVIQLNAECCQLREERDGLSSRLKETEDSVSRLQSDCSRLRRELGGQKVRGERTPREGEGGESLHGTAAQDSDLTARQSLRGRETQTPKGDDITERPKVDITGVKVGDIAREKFDFIKTQEKDDITGAKGDDVTSLQSVPGAMAREDDITGRQAKGDDVAVPQRVLEREAGLSESEVGQLQKQLKELEALVSSLSAEKERLGEELLLWGREDPGQGGTISVTAWGETAVHPGKDTVVVVREDRILLPCRADRVVRPRADSSTQEQTTATPKTQTTEQLQESLISQQPGVRCPDQGNQTLDWGAGSGPISTQVRTMAGEATAMEWGATEDQAKSIDDGAKEQTKAMEDRATNDQAKAIKYGREDQAKAINDGAKEQTKAIKCGAREQTKAIKYEATQDHTEALEDEAKDNQTEAIKNTGPSKGTDCKPVDKRDSQARAMETSTAERRAKTVESGTTDLQTKTEESGTTDLQTKTEESGTTDLQTKTAESGTTDLQTKTEESGTTDLQTKTVESGTTDLQTKTEESGTTDLQTKTVENGTTDLQTKTEESGTTDLQTKTEESGTTDLQTKTAAHRTTDLQTKSAEYSTTAQQVKAVEDGATDLQTKETEFSTTDQQTEAKGGIAGTQTEGSRREEKPPEPHNTAAPYRREVQTAGTQTEREEEGITAAALGSIFPLRVEVRTAGTQTEVQESGLGSNNSATLSKEVRTAETQTDGRLGEAERPGESGRTEGHQLVAQAFPWEANPAEIAERIMRNRSRMSVAFDDTEYEPYGLPEVVMRGFADIPSGPSCPYVLRRGLLGTALQTGKPRAASEGSPEDPTD
ncbi:centromere protein F-like isoform X2 [Acipenser ruthenus]|uniref:centromere protein F-like isoform X2 n=1 Tax=Acipenser ruthenus TaxID=7906 RepID=UPI002742354D|nr:centromere protein F-like isoform X2 [Acipenser ruthenus]